MQKNKAFRRSKEAIVTNELGIHARSAGKIAELAQKAIAKIWIIKDQQEADASSIIDMLTLMCTMGSKVTVVIDDPIDSNILDAIIDLIEDGFGE